MKKIFLALFAAATLLGAGCAKIDVAEGQLNVPEGEMAVKLGFTSPTGPGIRSYVSGEEKSISSIAMLCSKPHTRRDVPMAPWIMVL